MSDPFDFYNENAVESRFSTSVYDEMELDELEEILSFDNGQSKAFKEIKKRVRALKESKNNYDEEFDFSF